MARVEAPADAPRLSASARRERLHSLVLDAGFYTTTELSDRFAVSEMTVRRDIALLVQDGLLRNVHGGVAALPNSPVGRGRDYTLRAKAAWDAKRAIAAEVVGRLDDCSRVAFDAGTTAAAVAELFRPEREVMAVTHSLAVMNEFADREAVTVVGLGGRLHSQSLSFSGPQTVQAIRDLSVEILLLGASGLNGRGVFCGNDYDAETKRALIDSADRVILVSDSSKFSIPAMVRACPLDVIHEAVIDAGATPDQLSLLRDAGIAVTVVSPTTSL